MNTPSIARRIIVTGRVQGVGFRAFVCGQAEKLGLDGFVRNLRDGTVEALVAGETHKVEALIALCGQGPSASRVTEVKVAEIQAIEGKGFQQLPTV